MSYDTQDALENEELIKVRAQHIRDLFPRPPAKLGVGKDTFGITVWFVSEVLAGHPKNSNGDVINFGDEESGFFGANITITGEFSSPIDDCKEYVLLAKEVTHPKYGKQYQLLYMNENIDLRNMRGQRAFLKSFLTDLQIQELYKVFENPLAIIDAHNIKKLQEVKGIGPVLSEKICNRYEKCKDMSAIYMELDGMGLTSAMIQKLVQRYHSPTEIIDTVKNNPYQLTYDVDGIGFLTADKIALQGGTSVKSKKRIKAFINFFLKEQGEEGHSYITASELLVNIYNQLGGKNEVLEVYRDTEGNITGNNVQESIQELIAQDILGMEDNENKAMRRVYLKKYYNLEMEIAYHLKRLLGCKNLFMYDDWEEKVASQEQIQGFAFTDEQKAGIKLGLDNQVCYITGPAGCGKSSLVAGILSALGDDYSFTQTALSGKAAANLQEITGAEGMTIHRLLRYTGDGFEYKEDNTLPYDIIILDELSLCGGRIFLDLIKAIPDGAKLICLGDQNQLEAIGALNLAADMYNSPFVPTVKLTKVHRQAQESGILTTSYLVKDQIQIHPENDYEGIEIRGNLQDMILDCKIDKDDTKDRVMSYFNKYYYDSEFKKSIMEIQILCPVKERGDACVDELNKAVQNQINPVDENSSKPKVYVRRQKSEGGRDRSFWIQVGDKVMCIKNNYNVNDVYGNPTSIFNGWVGLVESIGEEHIIINFPINEYPTVLKLSDVGSHLILGYASTVHKCVTGDTWITTNKGIMQIQDVNESMIGELAVWNGKYFEKPDAFYVNPPLPTVSIKTKRNYEISGLINHKIFAFSQETSDFLFKDLIDLKINDEVLISKKEMEINEKINIPYSWQRIKTNEKAKKYSLPTEVDEDFASFLGCMVADGFITHRGIAYGKKDKDCVEKFKELVKKLFGYEGKIKFLEKENMYKTEINSVFIKSFCSNIPGIQPHNKFVPDIILKSSQKVQRKFLSCLFEDGNVNLKRNSFDHIELSFNSELLINQVRFMLLNFGIITTKYIRTHILNGKTLNVFELFIYKKEAQKFVSKIGFLSQKNILKTKSLLTTQICRDVVSSIGLYKMIKPLFDNKEFKISKQLFSIKQHSLQRKRITSQMALMVIDEYENQFGEFFLTKRVKKLLKDFYIDKVVSVKPSGNQTTYCFNMPETHRFVQNGILGSNCQGSGYKVVIGALDYSTPPQMLTHQLVYTLLTRAKKECVLVTQTGALKKAIATDYVSTKRTFLPEFLDGRLKIVAPKKPKKKPQPRLVVDGDYMDEQDEKEANSEILRQESENDNINDKENEGEA